MAQRKSSAKKSRRPKAKITFRHNFLPVIVGILAFGGILGLLNSQWLSAQLQYKFAPKVSAASIQREALSKAPTDASQLMIPAIATKAPIVFDEPSFTEWKIQLALRKGVVHYGTTALPGQRGNVVIIGHSSGQLWAPGDYKFIFTLLDKLKKGDLILLDYKGTRYIYKVSGSEIVDPANFSVIQPSSTPQLTLITCTPVGTSKNRLVVHAEQISPHPSTAKQMTSDTKSPLTTNQLPQ